MFFAVFTLILGQFLSQYAGDFHFGYEFLATLHYITRIRLFEHISDHLSFILYSTKPITLTTLFILIDMTNSKSVCNHINQQDSFCDRSKDIVRRTLSSDSTWSAGKSLFLRCLLPAQM